MTVPETWKASRPPSSAALPPHKPPPTTTTFRFPPATSRTAPRRIERNIGAGQRSGVGCCEPGDDPSELLNRKRLLADARKAAHVGGNAGGADRIDANSQGPAFDGQDLGQSSQSRLRGHISGHLRKLIGPRDAGQAAHVHDCAAGPHHAKGGSRAKECTPQADS